jgi:hypothetical protein
MRRLVAGAVPRVSFGPYVAGLLEREETFILTCKDEGTDNDQFAQIGFEFLPSLVRIVDKLSNTIMGRPKDQRIISTKRDEEMNDLPV